MEQQQQLLDNFLSDSVDLSNVSYVKEILPHVSDRQIVMTLASFGNDVDRTIDYLLSNPEDHFQEEEQVQNFFQNEPVHELLDSSSEGYGSERAFEELMDNINFDFRSISTSSSLPSQTPFLFESILNSYSEEENASLQEPIPVLQGCVFLPVEVWFHIFEYLPFINVFSTSCLLISKQLLANVILEPEFRSRLLPHKLDYHKQLFFLNPRFIHLFIADYCKNTTSIDFILEGGQARIDLMSGLLLRMIESSGNQLREFYLGKQRSVVLSAQWQTRLVDTITTHCKNLRSFFANRLDASSNLSKLFTSLPQLESLHFLKLKTTEQVEQYIQSLGQVTSLKQVSLLLETCTSPLELHQLLQSSLHTLKTIFLFNFFAAEHPDAYSARLQEHLQKSPSPFEFPQVENLFIAVYPTVNGLSLLHFPKLKKLCCMVYRAEAPNLLAYWIKQHSDTIEELVISFMGSYVEDLIGLFPVVRRIKKVALFLDSSGDEPEDMIAEFFTNDSQGPVKFHPEFELYLKIIDSTSIGDMLHHCGDKLKGLEFRDNFLQDFKKKEFLTLFEQELMFRKTLIIDSSNIEPESVLELMRYFVGHPLEKVELSSSQVDSLQEFFEGILLFQTTSYHINIDTTDYNQVQRIATQFLQESLKKTYLLQQEEKQQLEYYQMVGYLKSQGVLDAEKAAKELDMNLLDEETKREILQQPLSENGWMHWYRQIQDEDEEEDRTTNRLIEESIEKYRAQLQCVKQLKLTIPEFHEDVVALFARLFPSVTSMHIADPALTKRTLYQEDYFYQNEEDSDEEEIHGVDYSLEANSSKGNIKNLYTHIVKSLKEFTQLRTLQFDVALHFPEIFIKELAREIPNVKHLQVACLEPEKCFNLKIIHEIAEINPNLQFELLPMGG